ncbi:hypothetical protein KW868_17380 [Acinetobacter guillouiae]|uniref:Restriction endonuclease n=1 Tax=Acinetobacter guillouiae TaxID=106649 RepID=A0A8X8KGL6_ACIGI|nr:hypothetical protein [Acinetobacter guillouiae]MCF0266225.1 hypothetical protein [Acinetobacter guillouiae]
MNLPNGKLKKEEIDKVFSKSIKYHIDSFYTAISDYEPRQLYCHWRTLVRSIDEIINIPLELPDDNEINQFLNLNFNFSDPNNIQKLGVVLKILENRFNKNVALRFKDLAMMCMAIDISYQSIDFFSQQGNVFRLNNTKNAITYLQSRRAYYITTLQLIPKIARGRKVIDYIDTLNFLQYPMDNCLVQITTAYYNLLLNNCLTDFEIDSNGTIAKSNFEYDHLEGFFMEPERLSLLDQMELRPETVISKQMLPKAVHNIFSFSEVANTMILFEGAFDKYKIQNNIEYKELNLLMYEIAIFLKDDFNITIDEDIFYNISSKYKSLMLFNPSDNYFDNLNSYSPFQKFEGKLYTTVVLLNKFIYRTLSQSLLKNRTFQIHSGFIFEDKVSRVLETKGYKPTSIKRINHKEFDLITIKDNKVFNFQCKNNFIDISRINYNLKKITRFNQRLCRYYENAIIKEEKREHFINSRTGISDIQHFVISRYPIISRNKKIINFTELDNWNSDK